MGDRPGRPRKPSTASALSPVDPKRAQEFRQRRPWRGGVEFEDAVTNDGGLMRLARPDRVDRSGVGSSFRDLPPMPVEY